MHVSEILKEIELWQTGMSLMFFNAHQVTTIKLSLAKQQILIVIEHWVYLVPLSIINFFRQGVIKYTVKTFVRLAFPEKSLWFHAWSYVFHVWSGEDTIEPVMHWNCARKLYMWHHLNNVNTWKINIWKYVNRRKNHMENKDLHYMWKIHNVSKMCKMCDVKCIKTVCVAFL